MNENEDESISFQVLKSRLKEQRDTLSKFYAREGDGEMFDLINKAKMHLLNAEKAFTVVRNLDYADSGLMQKYTLKAKEHLDSEEGIRAEIEQHIAWLRKKTIARKEEEEKNEREQNELKERRRREEQVGENLLENLYCGWFGKFWRDEENPFFFMVSLICLFFDVLLPFLVRVLNFLFFWTDPFWLFFAASGGCWAFAVMRCTWVILWFVIPPLIAFKYLNKGSAIFNLVLHAALCIGFFYFRNWVASWFLYD